jgi:microcystin-dependent protein
MAQPYVGEIRIFAGNFAPAGWMFCAGQLLPISEYETLFNLIGTIYGGDGQSTFALPDLRGRLPIHMGTSSSGTYSIGQQAGTETVTLTLNQIPSHSHAATAQSGGGGQSSPNNGVWANGNDNRYSSNTPTASMNAQNIQNTGGSQPHDNLHPYLCVSLIISLFGIFPSQN